MTNGFAVGWCHLSLTPCLLLWLLVLVFEDLGLDVGGVGCLVSSSSDMLIIRHGRSRVRHSTQKNHIRWGLRAFDNLTLDYDYDNDTMDASGNQSSLYMPAGSDVFYVNGSGTGGGGSGERTAYSYSTATTTTTDTEAKRSSKFSSTFVSQTTNQPRKKIKKKQIMANIQKTVDKGVEYLKSHAHLLNENVELNSMRPLMLALKADKDTTVQLPSPVEDTTATMHTGTTTPIPSMPPPPIRAPSTAYEANDIQNDDSLAAVVAADYARNDGDVISKTLSPSWSSPFASATDDNDKDENHAKEVPVVESNTRPSSPVVNENEHNHHNYVTTQEPYDVKLVKTAPISAAVALTKKNSNNSSSDGGESDKMTIAQQQILQQGEERNGGDHSSIGVSIDDVTMIDDEAADYSGVDTKRLYSDGVVSDAELEGWFGSNSDVVDDYANLELLDDTSRQNRKNLLKGRDVVTKFLQIVETQHLLGANCTAGTDLNLGEGVVDRYAHDRFRVEAEIAVNRANMLTR